MHCILVFDHLNDIVFSKCDKKFVKHIQKLGEKKGISLSKTEVFEFEDEELNINFAMQLFSPIVTSQRVMSSQFGNCYSSIQCDNGINMVFEEYMEYMFISLGSEEVNWLKRMLGVCISVIRHVCGPSISLLKTDKDHSLIAMRLIDTWLTSVTKDQSVLLESLEQLFVNTDVNKSAIKALKDATERIKNLLNFDQSHGIIFVENKLLSLFSSKNAHDLSGCDLLFLGLFAEMILTDSIVEEGIPVTETILSDESISSGSPNLPKSNFIKSCRLITEKPEENLFSYLVLLSEKQELAVTPYIIHISRLSEGVTLILLYQTHWALLNSILCEALNAINDISALSVYGKDKMRTHMGNLDAALKKISDIIKKMSKSMELTTNIKECIDAIFSISKLLKKHWNENQEAILCSTFSSLRFRLKELIHLTVLNKTPVLMGEPAAKAIARCVYTALADFFDFLKVKAISNFTLGSLIPLSVAKYLEEFPGLVHFIYLDRTNHRITAPSLEFLKTEPPLPQLTKEKIWEMVEFSRINLINGNFSVMWRDATFSYAYYLWFENGSGLAMTPKPLPSINLKAAILPGVYNGNFYNELIDSCFPKRKNNVVRCYELYCIHIGLATTSCVLNQSRRIAATMNELIGAPSNPLDLL